jgi:hypothetical protein
MAKSQKIQETVVRRDKVDRYQLTLTEGEADFLQAVLATIGGHQQNSPRKYAIRIGRVLHDVTGQGFMQTDAHQLITGSLWFNDYPAAGETNTRAWRDRGLELLLTP